MCSFDIVRDTLGLVRTEFPHTVYFVAGTQVSFTCGKSFAVFGLFISFPGIGQKVSFLF